MAEEVSESRGYVLPAADHSQEIVNQLNMQRYYGSFCDITITVNNYEFKLHKCVLAAACPKLYAILYPLRESYQNNLSLKEVTVTGFKSLVEFMYTGHVKLDTVSLVQELYQAARYFEMGQIEKQCIDFIKNEIDINPYNEQNNAAEPVYRDSVDIPSSHNEQSNPIAAVYRESVDIPPTHNEQNNPIEPVYRDSSVDIPPTPQENSSLEAVMMHPYNSLAVSVILSPSGSQGLPLQPQVSASHPQPLTMSTHPMTQQQPMPNIVTHQPQLQDVSAPHTPQSGVIPATPTPASMNMPQSSSATNMSTFDANYIDDYLKLIETLQNEQQQQQQQQPILETHSLHGNHLHSMPYNSHRSNSLSYQRNSSDYLEHTQQQHPIQPSVHAQPKSISFPNQPLQGISFPNQTLQGNTYSAEDVRRTILSVLSQERFDEDVSNEPPMKTQVKEPMPLTNIANVGQSQKGKEQHSSCRPMEDNTNSSLGRIQLPNTPLHGRANMEVVPDSASESENEERFQEMPFQLPPEKQSIADNDTSFCMTIPPMHEHQSTASTNSISTSSEMVAHQYARTDFLDGLHGDGKAKDIVAEQLCKEQARLHGKKRILHKAKKAKENFDKSKSMRNLQKLNPPATDIANVVEEMIKERGKEFLSQEGIEDISDADEEINNVQKNAMNLDFRKNHDYFKSNVDESLEIQTNEECVVRELVIDTESNNEGHVRGQEVNKSGVKVRLPHRHTKMKLKLNVKSQAGKQTTEVPSAKISETVHEVSKTENLKMKPLKKRIKHFKKYKCDQCAREFLRQDSLDKHLTMHEKTSLHKCPYCTMKYIRVGELTRHLRTHQIVTFKCKDCDFESCETKKLRRHCLTEHDNQKPYHCDHDDCDYSTNKPCNLNKHQLIHSGKKLFACSNCKKEFTQQNGLNSHYKSCLKKQSYLCDLCGQGFNHLQGMKIHRNTHTGAKPYQCETCEASFSDQRNFKRHLRIHQQIFPYPCTHCERKFRHSNSLKSHLKSAHKMSKPKAKEGKKTKKKEK